MELTGQLKRILPMQSGTSAKGPWQKQDFVIEINNVSIPRIICFTAWGDLLEKSAVQVGETIDVSFDPESREFNGKWYTDLKAWKIERTVFEEPVTGDCRSAKATPVPELISEDDLPF